MQPGLLWWSALHKALRALKRMDSHPAWPSTPTGGGTLFGFWVKGWSIPQRVARLPPIIRRMLFKQIPPGITFRRLNLYKSQASEMAWKTVLSLAELTPNHGKISSRTRHMFLYMHPEGTVQSALSPVKSVENIFFKNQQNTGHTKCIWKISSSTHTVYIHIYNELSLLRFLQKI